VPDSELGGARSGAPTAPSRPLPVDDPAALALALVGIGSVSGEERAIADAIEDAVRRAGHLDVVREGNCVVAATRLGRERRVVVAGHIDTVPPPTAVPLPVRVEDGTLWGRGSVDMLGGVAMALHTAVRLADPVDDVTYVFYDLEEVEADRNGLTRLARTRSDLLAGDVAVLGEPTDLAVEGGCQGTLTVAVVVRGRAAHTARAWLGHNAIHEAAAVVSRIGAIEPRRPVVDGLRFHEGLQVVAVDGGGPARNVVPDRCRLIVNHRFAPDRDVPQALDAVRAAIGEHEITVLDAAAGARPGLDRPMLRDFARIVAARTGRSVKAKLGWTDVARFTSLGIPAVNFGPGRPELAHADDERVPLADVTAAADVLCAWLGGG
jgi:succinyl-diaminopimelate desuccinylase